MPPTKNPANAADRALAEYWKAVDKLDATEGRIEKTTEALAELNSQRGHEEKVVKHAAIHPDLPEDFDPETAERPETPAADEDKPRRGRPPGSKNKPAKDEVVVEDLGLFVKPAADPVTAAQDPDVAEPAEKDEPQAVAPDDEDPFAAYDR